MTIVVFYHLSLYQVPSVKCLDHLRWQSHLVFSVTPCFQSLNILTLGALTVAIGRVIDDSIVVVENIYRRLSDSNETMKGENLIINATTEVFKPIMSSTLVTIVVFYHLSLYQVPSVKCLDHLRWQSHLVF